MVRIDNKPTIYSLAIIITILPLLFLQTPPLVDYAGHLGRMTIQLDAGQSPYLSQWYSFNWGLIPNLGTDLLVQALSPWFEAELSLKYILIATAALQASGYIYLSRVVHGSTSPTVLFALPLVYNFAFQFGFLNFLLSMAMATWAIAYWIKLGAQQSIKKRALIFALFAPILWVTHLVGWALLLVYAGSDELVRNYRRYGKSVRTITACILPCLTLLTPLIFYALQLLATSEVGETERFFKIWTKLAYFLTALKDRWAIWDISAVAIIVLLLGWIYRSRKYATHAGLTLGAGILLIIYILIPAKLIGSAYADMRLVPFMLASALIAAKPSPSMSRNGLINLTIFGLIFFLARTAGTTISLHQEDQQFQADLAVLDQLPRGSNMVSFAIKPCDKLIDWPITRHLHLPAYAITRRHAFSNEQWAMAGGQLLSIHNAAVGEFESDPSHRTTFEKCKKSPSLRYHLHRLPDDLPYLWVIGAPSDLPINGWHKIAASGRSQLYARQANP